MLAYTTKLLQAGRYGQVAPTMLAGLADVWTSTPNERPNPDGCR